VLLCCGGPDSGRSSEALQAGHEPPCDELRVVSVPENASLVLIVSDTMRRDAAGVYGGRARTPAFDGFARQHLLFRRAVSQAPWTKPSIATLFTSLYPSQHGVKDDPHRRGESGGGWSSTDILGSERVTLAEVLQGRAFRTAAFVSNPWMEERFGFAQGFQVYDDSFAEFDAAGELVTRAGTDWLSTVGSHERFFLYLHYIDAHRPYGRLAEQELMAAREQIEADARPLREEGEILAGVLRLEDGRGVLETGIRPSPTLIQMSYDRGVERFDQALGEFLAALESHPLDRATAVIIVSDHGEALFTRGYGNHGRTLLEDEIAIPMAARLPGVEGPPGDVACLVGLVDVMPTVCDYLDLPCPLSAAGQSFLDPAAGELREPRYLVSEGLPGHAKHRTLQNRKYKLHYDPGGRLNPHLRRNPLAGKKQPFSLYDLEADPDEERDLLRLQPRPDGTDEILRIMSSALVEAVKPADIVTQERAPLDPAMRERLRALGYLESRADTE